ncbi:hypothetical protein [Candidatus Thiodiazotropha sp. LNASS1]|uniref:phosphorylase family protein n=1 Tax=Candidatus Thiodiazotropha sp. LNASS1 TaxID=3096260 RepID=UPI0034E01EFA
MRRASIRQKTVKRLFASSGGICAFPGCTTALVDAISGALLGEMCHIHAASPGGPRFDPSLSEEERNKEENIIILCPTHHSLIDQEPEVYSAEQLKTLKKNHEENVAAILAAASAGISQDEVLTTDLARQVDVETVDFAVVVALPKELDALKKHIPELGRVQASQEDSRTYYKATVRTGIRDHYRIVVTLLPTMGNLDAAHATADLINRWNPRYILVAGIAGGINSNTQRLGDIIVSESIVYYEPGKVRDSQTDVRNRQFLADRTLLDGFLNLENSAWRNSLPSRPDHSEASTELPKIHIGPVASGEKVIASSQEVQRLLSSQRNLIGIEMESAGVASAAFGALKKVGFITIRSICDFADNQKNDNWQSYAAHAAAAYLRVFIESRPVAPSAGDWPKVTETTPHPKETTKETKVEVRKRLFNNLCDAMDMENFKSFCFVLGVDVDELPGERKSARVRELILLFERKKQIAGLDEAFNEFNSNNID